MGSWLHDGFCFPPFPMEGPDGVSEELGALASRALAHAEGQQHEAPQVSHQQPEQRGHRGEQHVRSYPPGLLQLNLQHPPTCGPAAGGLGSHPRLGRPSWGPGKEGHTHTYIPASPPPTHQTGKWAVPPGTCGHIFSEEKQPVNLITVAGREEKLLLLK